MIHLDDNRQKVSERFGLVRLERAERENELESRQHPLSEDVKDFAFSMFIGLWTAFGIIGLITTFQMFRDLL